MPTEPVNEPHLLVQPEGAAPTEPVVDSASEGVPMPQRQKRRDGNRHRRHSGEHKPQQRPKEAKPELVSDPISDEAKLVYAEAAAKFNDILSNPATTRTGDDGVTVEDLPEEDYSFAARMRFTAENMLNFDYSAKPDEETDGKKKHRAKRGPERPYKKVEDDQSADDHLIARNNVIDLVTNGFDATIARLDTEIAAAKVKANVGGKGEAVLKVTRGEKGGPTLADWLESSKRQLEWMRLDAIRDAQDWFDARVNQMETSMHTLTERGTDNISVARRLEALQTNEDFNEQLENLAADIKMFESFVELPLTPGCEKIKGIIQTILKDAQRNLKHFEGQKAILLKLGVKESKKKDENKKDILVDGKPVWEVDEENGSTKIDRAKKGIAFDFAGYEIGDKFMAEAEKRMVGLSPEQELNFWEALRELFAECSDEIPKELKGQAFQAAREDKLRKLNTVLGLYTVDKGVGYLVKIDDRTNPGEKIPYGFGQIVERCRAEALMAAELKEKLRDTTILAGFDCRKATQTLLRGKPNSVKIAAVEKRLNVVLKKKQEQAFAQLQATKKETPDMNDAAKAALAEANAAAEAFKTELAGRKVDRLRWNRRETDETKKVADRPLITKIRAKTFELLGLNGKFAAEDKVVLKELLFPAPVTEAGAEIKPETVAGTWVDQIMAGKLPEDLFEEDGPQAEQYAELLQGIDRRLGIAVQSGVVKEGFLKQAVLLQPEKLTLELLNTFVDQLEALVKACEEFKKTFGDNWRKEFGLWKADPAKPEAKRGLGNAELIIGIMEKIKAGVDPKQALFEVGLAAAEAAGLEAAGTYNEKAEAAGLRSEAGDATPEATAEKPTVNILKTILDGSVDAALVAEVYPHKDGQDDVTVESLQADMREMISDLVTASHSQALVDAIIEDFALTVLADSSAAHALGNVCNDLMEMSIFFKGMNSRFGDTWATETGLLILDPANETELIVNHDVIKESLRYIAQTENIMDAFAFDNSSIAQEKLYPKLDADVRGRLTTLEIPVQDQLYFAMLCVPIQPNEELPEPNVGLRRLTKCIEMSAKQRKGQELLSRLHLKTGDVYENEAIRDVMTNDNWDR